VQTLIQGTLIVLAGSTAGLLLNIVRPDGISLRAPDAGQEAPSDEACVAPAVQARITLAEALELYHARQVVFADARVGEEYATGHVAGAFHLPCQPHMPAWPARVGRDATVVIYADERGDADLVAQALIAGGHGDVRVMNEGFAAWQAAGGPSETGTCEICE
jgi:3-mercaptopyruvate sulfurtransferase SseA